MNHKSMDVFSLRDWIIDDYQKFATSFTTIHAEDIRTQVEKIYSEGRFPIVKRKDEAAYGEYRTKRLILEIYDAMAEAAHTGIPYETRLHPPPARQA
ncbi:MAG TPA: hypothetical protein VG736_09025 [Vicinamibacterales bacterium]|nr:hypothetical protein [Vicinamibacterales bacterium]